MFAPHVVSTSIPSIQGKNVKMNAWVALSSQLVERNQMRHLGQLTIIGRWQRVATYHHHQLMFLLEANAMV